MAEKIVRLNDEQWGVLKVALDGEIADLQRLLQQARERIRELETCYLGEKWKELVAERDAAIERAEAAEKALVFDSEADEALTARVLRAEKAAAEQRALVWRDPERLAALFHEAYGRLAQRFGYKTPKASSGRWEQVPDKNKRLMIATCRAVIAVAPAEALRAEHRGPQSGQEEAPDD